MSAADGVGVLASCVGVFRGMVHCARERGTNDEVGVRGRSPLRHLVAVIGEPDLAATSLVPEAHKRRLTSLRFMKPFTRTPALPGRVTRKSLRKAFTVPVELLMSNHKVVVARARVRWGGVPAVEASLVLPRQDCVGERVKATALRRAIGELLHAWHARLAPPDARRLRVLLPLPGGRQMSITRSWLTAWMGPAPLSGLRGVTS